MVHLEHTPVALTAVMRPVRLGSEAALAHTDTSSLFLLECDGLDYRLRFENVVSRLVIFVFVSCYFFWESGG